MSILSQAINAYKSGTPLTAVVTNFVTQVTAWGEGLIKKAESDPSVAAAVNLAVGEAAAAASTAISWADTALASDLSDFGDEIAGLIVKYGSRLAVGGAPVNVASTLVGALVDVAVATVHHEALALQTQIAGVPATVAASSTVTANPQ